MARVKGRDVVIDLMDAVAKLQATASEHAELLASMAAHAVATSARLNAISGQMNHTSQRMGALETDFQLLAENFVQSAKLQRTTRDELGRLARLLGDFAGTSQSKFEQIEGRLVKLERKVG